PTTAFAPAAFEDLSSFDALALFDGLALFEGLALLDGLALFDGLALGLADGSGGGQVHWCDGDGDALGSSLGSAEFEGDAEGLAAGCEGLAETDSEGWSSVRGKSWAPTVVPDAIRDAASSRASLGAI